MKCKLRAVLLCLGAISAGVLNSSLAVAGPADYVYTPTVEKGEREIDFKFGTAKQKDGTTNHVTSLGFGYGATESWFTELYLKRESGAGSGLSIAEWENKFQLTETGKYPVDVGFIVEFEAPLSNRNDPYELKVGPLFQTDFGKLQLNGNVLVERKFGHHNDGDDPYVSEMGYQLQAKYRLKQELEFGMQAMGEVGQWDDWSQSSNQNHRMGPAIFGKFGLGTRQAIKYNAAWLFGISNIAPNNTFRMQAEYEF